MVLNSNIFDVTAVVTVVALEVATTAGTIPEVMSISNIFAVTAFVAIVAFEEAATAAGVSAAIVVVNERTVVFTK